MNEDLMSVRARFPFLPGEVFYGLYGGAIRRFVVYGISLEGAIAFHYPDGTEKVPEGPWRHFWKWSEMFSTADACREMIPVEEPWEVE